MREIYRNKKNGQLYEKHGFVMDMTNSRVGTYSVLYSLLVSDDPVKYVREAEEFNEKFEQVDVEAEMAATIMVASLKL